MSTDCEPKSPEESESEVGFCHQACTRSSFLRRLTPPTPHPTQRIYSVERKISLGWCSPAFPSYKNRKLYVSLNCLLPTSTKPWCPQNQMHRPLLTGVGSRNTSLDP